MKKTLILIILNIVIILAAVGCIEAPSDSRNKIAAPKNNRVPLQGKWKIERLIGHSPAVKNIAPDNEWIGKTAEFTGDAAKFGSYFWQGVSYKIKRVKTAEYFMYKSDTPPEKLGIKEREILVVTVSAADKFLYEFIKIDGDRAIANIEDGLFEMKHLSDEVDDEFYDMSREQTQANEIESANEETSSLRSGLLLGIRSLVKTKPITNSINLNEYKYKTIWIASNSRQLHPVLEADDIFLPRKSGFWKVGVRKITNQGLIEDKLFAYSISEEGTSVLQASKQAPDPGSIKNGRMCRSILYAGNDYISVEDTGYGTINGSSSPWEENNLVTLPVDIIGSAVGVKISDIAGDDGQAALENGLTNSLNPFNSTNTSKIEKENIINTDESFALFRKTGHWFIRSRLCYVQNGSRQYSDFNINMVPPKELVAYDTLHISWPRIKDKVPRAIDAYTSPQKDIAVILSKDSIMIYAINNTELSERPIKTIALKSGDSVVMAEWATGSYVDKWEKTFISYNSVKQADKE